MNTKELGKLKTAAKKAFKAWDTLTQEHKTAREALAEQHAEAIADPAKKAGEALKAVKDGAEGSIRYASTNACSFSVSLLFSGFVIVPRGSHS